MLFRIHMLMGASAVLVLSTQSQVMPLKISLDGGWLFAVDSEKVGIEQKWYGESFDRSEWQIVETPNFWELYPGLADYDGWGWYARTFTFEKTHEPMSLHFAGVDDDAVVWLNGMEVGSHTGSSDPFVVDVGSALRTGENTIVVQVMDYGGGGGIYKPVTLIETRHLDELLKGPYSGMPALKSADWVKDAVVYEVYLRSFSKEGTFAGLEKRVPELKQLGVTVIYLMPIHPIGLKNRKGTLGSPYAVQDYYAINPEYGSLKDFKKLLATVHKNGMKLIIDLAANHTSWDSRLMKEHPEWFTRDSMGEIVSPNADWTDVAQLDYTKPDLRKYMIEMMRWWVKDIGIDGFRCDVAELVPTDFWEAARKQLNRIKPLMMISEGSMPEHHVRAFDITYSWNIYQALDVVLKGMRPATFLDDIFKTESLQFPVGSLRLRFTSNHDKNAVDSPAVVKFGPDGATLAAVLVNTVPGVPMIYNGEEVANERPLSLFNKVDIDWSAGGGLRKLYATLFKLRRDHKALSRGEMIRLVSNYDQSVYAFIRSAGSDKVLVVLNLSTEPRFTSIRVPLENIFPGRKRVAMKEVFSGTDAEISAATGEQLVLALEPYEFRVFVQK
jgi:cyclomaltodextrinase